MFAGIEHPFGFGLIVSGFQISFYVSFPSNVACSNPEIACDTPIPNFFA